MILAFCDKSYIVEIILIIKTIFKIACYITPLLVIIVSIIHIFKSVLSGKDEDLKDSLKVTVKRIIAGLIIAFLPALINYVFTGLLDVSEVEFLSCFESATKERVASLKAKEEAEAEAERKSQEKEDEAQLKKAWEAEQKQKGAKKQSFEEWKKKKEEEERRQRELEQQNSSSSNNNSNSGNNDATLETSYGVFLGLDHGSGIDKLTNYKLVVIDLQEYDKSDIDKLHAKGIKVYSYLNVGSVEKYRNYYQRFKDSYLGTYEDWPDEKWVDVSNKNYQNFIINELEPSLRSKGADGYFIDNCDVYAIKKNDKIYEGLKTILSSIHSHGLPMLINGGDEFVSKAISDGSYNNLFDGVNQEEVFTQINFDNYTYKKQSDSEKKYYQNYLQKVKSKNLTVYLLEYGASSELEKEIAEYCQQNGFAYYNAKTYNLQ